MKKIIRFIKKETVLSVAWILAIISALIVHPSLGYIEYIDFRSLGILWGLMVIMAGLKENGLFDSVGKRLLKKTHKVWELAVVLVMLCFFSSMFITNDVALLTFVPFAIYMLEECEKEQLLIPVITLQTIAANLGSMLTPIGNPQNLYLYGVSQMSLAEFVKMMFPFSAITLILLLISVMSFKGKTDSIDYEIVSAHESKRMNRKSDVAYGLLFVFALLVVARVVPAYVFVIVVLISVLAFDKKTLLNIDYALLFTFVGFFIFTGNLGNIESVNRFLTSMVNGREIVAGVLASQFISNVPAALLLSGFTDNYSGLILGVNLGGLGTLIASMASLISFKSLAHTHNDLKGKYLVYFTIMNVVYLAILLVSTMIFC